MPAALLFEAGITFRNTLYDAGIFKNIGVGIPVISVGNITAGGTGKTPFVEYLLRSLAQMGKKAAVVSRGYGRSSTVPSAIGAGDADRGNVAQLGDELCQIARKFPQVTVIANADRVEGALLARSRYGAEVVVLDDGFQQRRITRDLDIALVDSTRPLRGERMLPAGLRREPVSSLRRAGLVVYTRVDQACNDEIGGVKKLFPGIEVRFVPAAVRSLDGSVQLPPESWPGMPCVAFCAIGNPEAFFGSLRQLGFDVRQTVDYPDHHWFSAADIETLCTIARGHGCMLITTEKDAIRLDGQQPDGRMHDRTVLDTLRVLEIRAEIVEGEDLLQKNIMKIFSTAAE